MADAGAYYAQAGANVGQAFADAMNEYHKEHLKHDELYGKVDAMQRLLWSDKKTGAFVLNPPMDESGTKPVNKDLVSPFNSTVIEQYKNFNRQQASKQEGGMEALLKVGQDAISRITSHPEEQKYPVQLPGGQTVNLTGPQAATYSARVNRPTATKTTNPDLNFTHAVNAQQNQLNQIDDSMYQNYGVHPVDILQSDRHAGFTFNKDTNKYVAAPSYEKADAITVNTGEGPKFFSKDQFEALKQPAQDWQNLMQNPPKRDDPRFQAPQQAAAPAGFTPDARAMRIRAAYKSGQMSAEDAVAAIKALQMQ